MHNKKLSSLYYGKNITPLILELFHVIVAMFFKMLISFACVVIWLFTYERNTNGELTLRKARRIRALTKFKLWFYKHFKSIAKIFMVDGYLNYIHKRFED